MTAETKPLSDDILTETPLTDAELQDLWDFGPVNDGDGEDERVERALAELFRLRAENARQAETIAKLRALIRYAVHDAGQFKGTLTAETEAELREESEG